MVPLRLTRRKFLFVRFGDAFKRWLRRKPLSRAWKWFAASAGVVLLFWGLYGIWDYYQPSTEVTPTEWHTTDPFNSDFLVKNTSHYGLRNFSVNCYLLAVRDPGEHINLNYVLLSHIMTPVPYFAVGEQKTVHCRNSMMSLPSVQMVDFSLAAQYQLPHFSKMLMENHRYLTQPDINSNSLKWEALSLSDPLPTIPVSK